MALKEYQRKRKFERTPEPAGDERAKGAKPAGETGRFVVQKHAARRLHYDLRLEIGGTLKSWAVPKGPSLNPADKRLAVQTEDHPMQYLDFEAVIPEGNYGAGTMIVWDTGMFELEGELSGEEQLARGELKFAMHGEKLRGGFALVKLKSKPKDGKPGNDWLLIKHQDEAVDPAWDIDRHPDSALTGRTLEEVRQGLPPDDSRRPAAIDALEGAKKARMLAAIEPMLATLVDEAFSDPEWLFELKWDGVRTIAFVRGGQCRLQSRRGHDVTSHYPEIASLPSRLRAQEAIVDGEIVVLDPDGRGNFERLQSRMNVAKPSANAIAAAPVVYYIFDILYCDGYDLREVPLGERKRFLKQILDPKDPIRYSEHVVEQGQELYELAAGHGAEGIIGKQIHSKYVEARTPALVKFKITREVDAVVGGYTTPRGGRSHLGALLVGLYDDDGLRWIGGVGSGFDEKILRDLSSKLKKIETSECPFTAEPQTKEPAKWVKPELVARVKYHEMTAEGRLRQPVYLGLRDDLEPSECRFSGQRAVKPAVIQAATVATATKLTTRKEIENELFRGSQDNVLLEIDGKPLRLSNLNKVYFPEPGYTKRNLLAHYFRVADYILPFLKDRPMVLNRFPNGVSGKSFYQKDSGEDVPEWLETYGVYSEERKKETRHFLCNDLAALLYLTNLGCIEHHPWSSRIDEPECPDYVFFDLDPTDGTEFSTVVEVAKAVYEILQRLRVNVFMKTSGASGFHMYLPLVREYTYDQVRTFAEIVARVVAAQIPERVEFERLTGKRGQGRVLIDYSQNAYGRPLAAVYSVRPKQEAPVAAPVLARELKQGLSPSRFTIATMPERLKKLGDLWGDFWANRQRIEPALESLQKEIREKRIKLA